jgi:hypothetical protein
MMDREEEEETKKVIRGEKSNLKAGQWMNTNTFYNILVYFSAATYNEKGKKTDSNGPRKRM